MQRLKTLMLRDEKNRQLVGYHGRNKAGCGFGSERQQASKRKILVCFFLVFNNCVLFADHPSPFLRIEMWLNIYHPYSPRFKTSFSSLCSLLLFSSLLFRPSFRLSHFISLICTPNILNPLSAHQTTSVSCLFRWAGRYLLCLLQIA